MYGSKTPYECHCNIDSLLENYIAISIIRKVSDISIGRQRSRFSIWGIYRKINVNIKVISDQGVTWIYTAWSHQSTWGRGGFGPYN
jgi:hypothetical protein